MKPASGSRMDHRASLIAGQAQRDRMAHDNCRDVTQDYGLRLLQPDGPHIIRPIEEPCRHAATVGPKGSRRRRADRLARQRRFVHRPAARADNGQGGRQGRWAATPGPMPEGRSSGPSRALAPTPSTKRRHSIPQAAELPPSAPQRSTRSQPNAPDVQAGRCPSGPSAKTSCKARRSFQPPKSTIIKTTRDSGGGHRASAFHPVVQVASVRPLHRKAKEAHRPRQRATPPRHQRPERSAGRIRHRRPDHHNGQFNDGNPAPIWKTSAAEAQSSAHQYVPRPRRTAQRQSFRQVQPF